MKGFFAKLSIIGSAGIPVKYGGFEMFVEEFTKNSSADLSINVYCSSKLYQLKQQEHNGARLIYIPLNPNGIQSIPYDILSILHAILIAKSKVILILGVSGCLILPLLKLFYRGKIITNIDGLEWKRAKWNWFAKKFLKLSECVAVRCSDTTVTDNKVIQNYVKDEYGVVSKLIEYGADHVSHEKVNDNLLKKYPFLKEKYACKVCRIDPENNVQIILEAFKEIKDINLVIIGNWNNSNYGRNLKEEFKCCSNIFLLDPIYGQETLNAIRSSCYCYIHGHSAGGTNPSLVEAMYLKLPIIAYDVSFNWETTEGKALYFKDKSELIDLLANMSNDIFSKCAQEMFKIANKRYLWDIITKKYKNIILS